MNYFVLSQTYSIGTNRRCAIRCSCPISDVSTNRRYMQLGLCTSTQFIIISVNRHRYQNQYGHPYSFDIHFDMFLTRNTWKMQENYFFCSELCWKLLCWHVNCVLPLFCAGTKLSQRTTIQEISCWEDIEETILVGIFSIKQCFYCN